MSKDARCGITIRDMLERRCGYASCPNGTPLIPLEGAVEVEWHEDSPGEQRAHFWLDLCSVECMFNWVRDYRPNQLPEVAAWIEAQLSKRAA